MLAHQKIDKNRRPPRTRVAYLLLLLTFLWAFLGTIDGPTVNFGIASGTAVYKIPETVDSEHGIQPGPLCIGVFPDEPLPVHASFLLFDFKQNLRQWPNVSGDISRSPPFLRSL
jgi:hypothetical protein